jgi:hypothetical protein
LNRGEFDSALEILDRAYKAHRATRPSGGSLAEAEASFVEKAYRTTCRPQDRHALEGMEVVTAGAPLPDGVLPSRAASTALGRQIDHPDHAAARGGRAAHAEAHAREGA